MRSNNRNHRGPQKQTHVAVQFLAQATLQTGTPRPMKAADEAQVRQGQGS
jgi:hypothetical protein